MSTKTEHPASDKPSGDKHHDHEIVDEQTGVYGWFRRHQKKLLYSVGMFVLIFFSISGPMMAAIRDWFEPERPMPTIQVGGQKVKVQPTDYDVGQKIANSARVLSSVLPMINVGEGGRSEAGEVYAWLRRAAIAEGLDVSMIEVDRAIAAMMERGSVPSATQMARQTGFGSQADFEMIIGEALRIGTLLQLQSLALDNSEARILEKVIGDREKIAFRVATFDEAARAEELEAAGGITGDDLKAWLDGKTDTEKNRLQVFDTNNVALRLGALMIDEFDRSEWEAEYLTDFEVGEEERQKLYNMFKARFEQPDGTFKPADDEEVIAELTRMRESQKVLQDILAKLTERRNTWTEAVNEEFGAANEAFLTAQNEEAAARQKTLDEPENEQAKTDLFDAEAKVTAMETAKEVADKAVQERFAAFDFVAAFAELTAGENGPRKGVVQREFTDKRNAKALEDLESDGLGLGKWDQANIATYLSRKGDFSFGPAWTEKATIIYQTSDVEVRPLKPWEDLEPLLRDAYFSEKAKAEADEKKQKLEDALLRLAKAKMSDKVAEIEGKRQARIDDKVAEWELTTQVEIDAAKVKLAGTRPGSKAYLAWEQKLEQLEKRKESKDARQGEIEKEIDEAITAEIADAAKKFHREVLDVAAAEAGFTVTDLRPLPRDLKDKPRFDKKYDHTTVFLFRNHSEAEEGDSTGVVQDVTNRRWHVAVCTGVMPLEASDIDRREFEMQRKGFFQSFAGDQAFTAFQQAFTKEALEDRYHVERPAGVQSEPEVGDK